MLSKIEQKLSWIFWFWSAREERWKLFKNLYTGNDYHVTYHCPKNEIFLSGFIQRILQNPQLRIWSHLPENFWTKNVIFSTVYQKILLCYVLCYFNLMKQENNTSTLKTFYRDRKEHFQHTSREFKKWCSLRVSKIGVGVVLA